jgi:hypothetical protein
MSFRDILDASIIEAPPPFRDIDELIAQERRRERRRRWAAVVTGTASVIGAALGVTLVAGYFGSGPMSGFVGEPLNAAAGVPANETREERYARLSDLLRTRIAAVLSGATVESTVPTGADLFGPSPNEYFPDYDLTVAIATVTTAQGSMDLEVYVLRPLAPPYPRPTDGVLGRRIGGCAGKWSTETPEASSKDTCSEHEGPGGSTISIAKRHTLYNATWVVTAAYPDGSAVTIQADAAATLLNSDELAEIITDPGYVA